MDVNKNEIWYNVNQSHVGDWLSATGDNVKWLEWLGGTDGEGSFGAEQIEDLVDRVKEVGV